MSDSLTIDRPIEGDITRRDRRVIEQGTVEEFLAAIDAVLAIPGVSAVSWKQYTPYFMDGDPCEFGVNDPYFTFGTVEEPEYGTDAYYDWAEREENYSVWNLTYKDDSGKFPYRPKDVTLSEADVQTIKALNLNRYELIAEANFGDHAVVTATSEGFNVEYYDHD